MNAMNEHEAHVITGQRVSAAPVEYATGPQVPPVSPYRILHRLLRGRYPWAVVLGLIGMAAGGYLGWNSQAPLYQAEALVYIRPTMASPADPIGKEVLPMFSAFVSYQVQLLASRKAMLMALETDAWRETRKGMSPEAIKKFLERRVIRNEGGGHVITIQFHDENPKVALAGVTALIEAYKKLSVEENSKDDSLQYAAERTELLDAKLKNAAQRILELSADFGGEDGLQLQYVEVVKQSLALEQELMRLRRSKLPPAEQEAASKPPAVMTAREISVESPTMAEGLARLAELEAEEAHLAQTMGAKNEKLIVVRQAIQVRSKLNAQFVEDWNLKRAQDWGRQPSKVGPGGPTQESLKAEETVLAADLASLKTERTRMATARVELDRLKEEIVSLTRDHEGTKAMRDQLAAQQVGKGRITIPDPGGVPTSPFKDRRRMMAAVMGVLGAMAGVFLVILLGLRDRKFKYTDDVGISLSQLKLLGLMPALPLDLLDPRGAEIAVHCVHQIRTMLQLGRGGEEGGCYCITGPGVGSGKTTLTLALGLSFGRSGSRTLLVDADLTGRGLTYRVGQLLLTHARRAVGTGEPTTPSTERELGGSGSRLLEPLVAARSMNGRLEPDELKDLLSRIVASLGVEKARDSGELAELFALADLHGPASVRTELESHLMALLPPDLPKSLATPSLWIPPRIRELESRRPEFNGTSLDRYLYPTGIESLQFLPLRGLGLGGGVSVATMSKILDRVRGEFDIVLVDTGPVLGAIETPMVAAHTDAVVFVVTPGDHRPDAELAVTQLNEVGARMAGVVFNRASPKDVFKASRSLSALASGTDLR